MSDSEDLSSFSALSLGSTGVPCDARKALNDDDGLNSLTEFESIQNTQMPSCILIQAPDDSQTSNGVKGAEIKHPLDTGVDKCLSKCATFPFSSVSKCSNDIYGVVERHKGDPTLVEDLTQKGSAQSVSAGYPRSISMPKTPLKLVSAMKGSREKLGAPPRDLRVKWAPDVYDPVPTAVSHVPNKKPQRYRNDYKRNGKNKKGSGKASRSKGKEKKQSRKSSGSSNKTYKLADCENSGASWSAGPETGALDFSVGCQDPFFDSQSDGDGAQSDGQQHGSTLDFGVSSPDPFCGHSFLKKSVKSMHFPVTEAT